MSFPRFLCHFLILGSFHNLVLGYDVVIYGGNPSAIVAAVQTKRMGKTVAVISPSSNLSGLLGNDLGWKHTHRKDVIGGVAREFYHRVWRHYQSPDSWKWQKSEEFGNQGQGTPAIDGSRRTMWVFEPKLAEQILESWLVEYEIEIFRDERLEREKGVEIKAGKIRSITTLSGKIFKGEVFIDCSYEGDLMAASKVDYRVGREGNDVYQETLNGVQVNQSLINQFVNRIDPFGKVGDPTSGLLPRISMWKPVKDGEGDYKIPAYHFPLCLTRVEENKFPFPKPQEYDPFQYELLLRTLKRGSKPIWVHSDPVPNAKIYTQGYGSFSINNIGMNYGYPEGTYQERENIIREHLNYQQGYFYFLCNDQRVPLEIREGMKEWGLARDEFTQSNHWPEQLNICHARRMMGEFILTENHIKRRKRTPRPVALVFNPIKSNHVQRYVTSDESGNFHVLNEGGFEAELEGPYSISYDSLIPREEQCTNLLVPVCMSASYVAYSSLCGDDVFMMLGQVAATAAVVALEQQKPLQRISYSKLKERLLEDGQVLESKSQKYLSKGVGVSPDSLSGVVVDGNLVEFEGEWTESSSLRPFVGTSYFHDGNGGKGTKSAKFPFVAPSDGLHEVKVSFSSFGNRAGNLNYEIKHQEGISKISVDQRKPQLISNLWFSLGTFSLTKGEQYYVRLSNENTEGYVVADAVQIIGLTPNP